MDNCSTPIENDSDNMEVLFNLFLLLPDSFFEKDGVKPNQQSVAVIKNFANELCAGVL